MNIRNIIFDVYGTLISTGTGSIDATKEIFKKYNLNSTNEDIYKKWKQIHRKNIDSVDVFILERELFIKDLTELFDLYNIKANARIEIKPMLDSLYNRKLFDETEYVIDKLLNKYNVAIGSTTDTEPLLQNMANTSLSSIKHIYTSENIGFYKPNPKFYKEILSRTGWNADECFFIGDSMIDDVNGPLSVGMKAILIDRNNRYNELPRGVEKINSLMEIISLL